MIPADWQRVYGEEIVKLHVKNMWSTRVISSWLLKKHKYLISHQSVYYYLKGLGLLRSHHDSMKARAIIGTMDYKAVAKKIDYKNRKMDYQKQWERRKRGISLFKHKRKILNLPKNQLSCYLLYAKKNKLTKSDTYKKLHPHADQLASYILRERTRFK